MGKCETCGAKWTGEPLVLYDEDIEEIANELHEKIQFYDSDGKRANQDVLDEIRSVLVDRFLPKGEEA